MNARKISNFLKDAFNSLNKSAIPLYYFSARKNFGDEIGPFIASTETSQPFFNVRDLPWEVDHSYCMVGSLLHSLNKRNCIVWGSGFICSPDDQKPKFSPKRILALRGPISSKFAEDLGWGKCDIYGDPGLLIPQYLPPDPKQEKKNIVVIPHYQFASAHKIELDNVEIVHPSRDLKDVAQSIASAELVISSSLHGIILAEAYRTPWVWWRQTTDTRKGAELKFQDFFQSLGITSPNFLVDDFYNSNPTSKILHSLGNLGKDSEYQAAVERLNDSKPRFNQNDLNL